jgi:prohibitin 2
MIRIFPKFSDDALLRFTLAVLIFAAVVAYFADNIFVSVPAGHVGVLWSRFMGGTQTDRIYKEGMHIFLPWDKLTLYDVRAQDLSQTIDSLTLDGLQISLTLDVRYHLIIDEVGELQRNVGADYENTILKPTVAGFARGQVARYTAEEVYSTQRSYIERVILDFMRLNRTLMVREGVTGTSFLNYDAVFINQVTLPATVQRAIESKVAQFEALREWKFRVQREQIESDRRLIEARASRDVLDTLGSRLTETFVHLRYLDVLNQLATSPNAKVVIAAPGGSTNPPVVLGVDGTRPAGPPSSAAESPAPSSLSPLPLSPISPSPAPQQ